MNNNQINEIIAKEILSENEFLLWEMANLRPKYTGLPMTIFASPKGDAKHSCRIKVQTAHGDKWKIGKGHEVSVTVFGEPKVIKGTLDQADFDLVKKFISKNRDALLQFWNDKIDEYEFYNAVVKIGDNITINGLTVGDKVIFNPKYNIPIDEKAKNKAIGRIIRFDMNGFVKVKWNNSDIKQLWDPDFLIKLKRVAN